jgi:hypothetical protein
MQGTRPLRRLKTIRGRPALLAGQAGVASPTPCMMGAYIIAARPMPPSKPAVAQTIAENGYAWDKPRQFGARP